MYLETMYQSSRNWNQWITLGIQINIHCTFINFGYFSQQYGLIWDRTFIRFDSMRFWTKIRCKHLQTKGYLSQCIQFFWQIFQLHFHLYWYCCNFLPNFAECMLFWIRMFNITSAKFFNQYAYLDLYVYLDPQSMLEHEYFILVDESKGNLGNEGT